MNKLKFVTAISLCAALSGCATPVTMLKAPHGSQVVRCGGDRSGAMVGGLIGYSLQSDDAAKCVQDFAAQGYKIIPTAPAPSTVK